MRFAALPVLTSAGENMSRPSVMGLFHLTSLGLNSEGGGDFKIFSHSCSGFVVMIGAGEFHVD